MDSHPSTREKDEARHHRAASTRDSRPSGARGEIVDVTEISPEETVGLSRLNIRPSTEEPDERPKSQKVPRKERPTHGRWTTEEMSFDHVSFTDNRGVTVGKEQLRYAKNGDEQMRAVRELGKPDSAKLYIKGRPRTYALPSRTGTSNTREVAQSTVTDNHSPRRDEAADGGEASHRGHRGRHHHKHEGENKETEKEERRGHSVSKAVPLAGEKLPPESRATPASRTPYQNPGSRSGKVSHASTPHPPHHKRKNRNGNVDPRAESPSRGPDASKDRHRDGNRDRDHERDDKAREAK